MKKYKIKYQKGSNIEIVEVEANSTVDARYKVYMDNPMIDILEVEEITD